MCTHISRRDNRLRSDLYGLFTRTVDAKIYPAEWSFAEPRKRLVYITGSYSGLRLVDYSLEMRLVNVL